MLDWAVVVIPVLIAVLVFFAPVPEAGRPFSVKWRAAIGILGVLTALLAYMQQRESAREKKELVDTLTKLRTVSPLRKQAADLAKELMDFYNAREHYNNRFKPGQALTSSETKAALDWYSETVRLYHAGHEKRIVSVLNEIHTATGMNVADLEADAHSVDYADGVQLVGTRLSAFAASLP